MTLPSRKLLLNLYSKPLDILKLAKDTQVYIKSVIKSSFNGNTEEIIGRLDDISDKMCVITDSTECIRRLHPDRQWRKAADEAFNSTCVLMNELNSDQNLAKVVNDLTDDGNSTELSAVIESFKRDFALFKDLSVPERMQVKRLQEAVDRAAIEFENLQSIGSLEIMIKLRFELAKALGFKNPLEIGLRDKQLNNYELVKEFIKEQWNAIGQIERGQKRLVYTNLKSVINALVRLSKDLFNVKIEVHSDYDFSGELSIKFKVYNENEFVGTILFDLSSRKNKDPHPTHYTIQCRKLDTPGLFLVSIGIKDFERISWNQSQSLFHEFGHALHSVLSETKYQTLSGTRGPVDLAEIPSSLLELIHDDSNLQRELNKNEKFEDISKERIYREESFQIQIAAFDQLLHCTEPPNASNWTRDLANQIETQYCLKRQKYWFCSLPHLSTYGGTYFSYLFSKSVALRIREADEMILFKRNFLAKGGSARLDFIK